jgi:hypothetical protein
MKPISKACKAHTKHDGSWWIKDAAGIPLCRVCDRCEATKRATYDPAIFNGGSVYAVTGEEMDIGLMPGGDY